MGKVFHNVGAATEKYLSPKDVNIFPRGNLVVVYHFIAADRQIDSLLKLNYWYTGVTDQAKI